MLASLIETCKLHSVNPQACLTDVLTSPTEIFRHVASSVSSALGLSFRHCPAT